MTVEIGSPPKVEIGTPPIWEAVDKNGLVQRMKVPGGWLYRDAWKQATMVYVPDPEVWLAPRDYIHHRAPRIIPP